MKSDENYCVVLLDNIIGSVWLNGRESLGERESVPGGGRCLSDGSPKVVV